MNSLPDFDELWNYADPQGSEQAFTRRLPDARAGGDRSYLAQVLTQVARAQGLQGRFDDAHATLDEAQALLAPTLIVARIRYLLERGRVFNSARQADGAQPLFVAAWQLASEHHEDFYAVDAAHMLAIVTSGEAQMTWNLRAVAIAEGSSDARARRWLGSLYNNIGWSLHERQEYAAALAAFEQALHFRKAAGQELAVARWCVARTLRSLGKVEEALAQQTLLCQEMEQRGAPDGYVYEELGECLYSLGRADDARPFFARAYAELSGDPWFVENEAARCERLRLLGEVSAAD